MEEFKPDYTEQFKNASPWPVALKWGILGGLTVIIISYILSIGVDYSDPQVYKDQQSGGWQVISYLPLILAIIMAQVEHRRKELGGQMSYGRAMGVATIVTLVFTVLYLIFFYLSLTVISPEMHSAIQDNAVQEALSRGGMSPEEEDMAVQMTKTFTSVGVLCLFVFFAYLFFGVVLSLLISIFTQKTKA